MSSSPVQEAPKSILHLRLRVREGLGDGGLFVHAQTSFPAFNLKPSFGRASIWLSFKPGGFIFFSEKYIILVSPEMKKDGWLAALSRVDLLPSSGLGPREPHSAFFVFLIRVPVSQECWLRSQRFLSSTFSNLSCLVGSGRKQSSPRHLLTTGLAQVECGSLFVCLLACLLLQERSRILAFRSMGKGVSAPEHQELPSVKITPSAQALPRAFRKENDNKKNHHQALCYYKKLTSQHGSQSYV